MIAIYINIFLGHLQLITVWKRNVHVKLYNRRTIRVGYKTPPISPSLDICFSLFLSVSHSPFHLFRFETHLRWKIDIPQHFTILNKIHKCEWFLLLHFLITKSLQYIKSIHFTIIIFWAFGHQQINRNETNHLHQLYTNKKSYTIYWMHQNMPQNMLKYMPYMTSTVYSDNSMQFRSKNTFSHFWWSCWNETTQ